jgi:hypothetical protein
MVFIVSQVPSCRIKQAPKQVQGSCLRNFKGADVTALLNFLMTSEAVLFQWDFCVSCVGARKGSKLGPSTSVEKDSAHKGKAMKYVPVETRSKAKRNK